MNHNRDNTNSNDNNNNTACPRHAAGLSPPARGRGDAGAGHQGEPLV